MALPKFKFGLPNKEFFKNNWKTVAAVGSAVVGAVGVGLLCAFFPPAIPFIAGITMFGAAPFAALASMSVVAASSVAASIFAAVFIAGSATLNAVTRISNLLDNLIRPTKTHVTDIHHEKIITRASPFNSPALQPKNVHGHPSKAANSSSLDQEDAPLVDSRNTKNSVAATIPSTTVDTAKVEELGTHHKRYNFHKDVPVPAKIEKDTTVDVTEQQKFVVGKP